MSSPSATTSHLTRLLVMVPYLQAHPGVSAATAARDLGTTSKQVMSDLNQLWMCGLPGYSPGDLIDLSFTEESIEVTFSAGIDHPLRLTAAEAAPLLIALRALIDTAGVVDTGAARTAIAKIEAAMGPSSGSGITAPTDAGPAESDAVVAVRRAVRDKRALRLRYYSASRDAVTDRIVDPVRLQAVEGNGYLEAWCRDSDGIRLFRFDRIDDAVVLDEPATPPPGTDDSAALGLFESDPALPSALIEIDSDVIWVMEYYLIEPADPDAVPDSTKPLLATMTYGSEEWLTRFISSFGGKIRVLDNPAVSAAITERATAALAMYEHNTSDSV
ncbi:protein pafC [Williamsia sp. 1138]|uniref:helix-turn-helix transcriptional regulator n=1 Tax=Williamsia sp. 1138 TaxID=1903117 RepID=UPI000A0F929E|nr:YafY family protein [Williamsia sp. 1138]OZG28559.1 protein pafC [Williamsia sp. 1138]